MYVGKPLRRREDIKFLLGRGQFVDDIVLPNTRYLAFVYSSHAHARIRRISAERARTIHGVIKVVAAEDWAVAGNGSPVCVHVMPFSDGRPMNDSGRPVFAARKVCHAGDIVAAVVATSRNTALDAAEAVEVDYEPLPAISETDKALDPDAPIIHEQFGTNLITEIIRGNRAATEAAFARAAHVTSLTLVSQRVAGTTLEPRSFLADHNPATGETVLWATHQFPHNLKDWICRQTLHIPQHKLRIIVPDVGGGFGVKGEFNREVSVVVWMARELGFPVKWTATRHEAFISDAQGRDHVTKARMAFDGNGIILGLEVDTIAALGAYISNFAPSIPGNSYPQTITGLYRTQALFLRVRCVYTNTLPVHAYRGSGRPEATFVNERLLENGAREMGIDVVEIRRRNLIQASEFPYPTPQGRTYDCGDPPALLDKLERMARYRELRLEQPKARADGCLLGIGLAAFLDKSGTGPSRHLAEKGGRHGSYESATVRIHGDGKATILAGTHSHGQGHEITYAAIAADRLGIPVEDIEVIEGDTGRVQFGNGTWGSRSASVCGAAIHIASELVLAKARRIAAYTLEASEQDLSYGNSFFALRNSNRKIAFAEIAEIALGGARLPKREGFEPGLEVTIFHDPPDLNDPEAMHLAVVLVDPETGCVRIRDYYTVDDCGNIINPMIVEGQIHGGLAQGIGQALMERFIYDPTSAQPLTGSLMDYALPRADDMPPLGLDFHVTPAPSNPLGVKGGSETGTIGPPAAIANAVVDALSSFGVRHVEQPMTGEAIWRAIETAKQRRT
jgi:carbon-monoxide dehydrogenase large subunit